MFPGPLDPGARSILARSFPVVSRLHAGVKGVSLPHQRRSRASLKGVYSGIIIFLPVVFPVESRLDPGEAGGLGPFLPCGGEKTFLPNVFPARILRW